MPNPSTHIETVAQIESDPRGDPLRVVCKYQNEIYILNNENLIRSFLNCSDASDVNGRIQYVFEFTDGKFKSINRKDTKKKQCQKSNRLFGIETFF